MNLEDWFSQRSCKKKKSYKVYVPSRELAYPIPRHIWVDDFPFPKVVYVSSLEVTFVYKSWDDATKKFSISERPFLGYEIST